MRQESQGSDRELVSLALETRQAANSIPDNDIHDRLIEIADELLALARLPVNFDHECRGFGWLA